MIIEFLFLSKGRSLRGIDKERESGIEENENKMFTPLDASSSPRICLPDPHRSFVVPKGRKATILFFICFSFAAQQMRKTLGQVESKKTVKKQRRVPKEDPGIYPSLYSPPNSSKDSYIPIPTGPEWASDFAESLRNELAALAIAIQRSSGKAGIFQKQKSEEACLPGVGGRWGEVQPSQAHQYVQEAVQVVRILDRCPRTANSRRWLGAGRGQHESPGLLKNGC